MPHSVLAFLAVKMRCLLLSPRPAGVPWSLSHPTASHFNLGFRGSWSFQNKVHLSSKINKIRLVSLMPLSNAFLCNSLICRLQPRIDEAISPVFYDFLLIMIPSFEKNNTKQRCFHFSFFPPDCLQKVRMEGGTEASGKSSARCISSLDNISFLKDEQTPSLSVTAQRTLCTFLTSFHRTGFVFRSSYLSRLPELYFFPRFLHQTIDLKHLATF